MSKFIYVTGEGDYGALMFENSTYSVKDIYDEMVKNGVTKLEKTVEDDGYEETLFFELLEFGDVDPKFVNFVLNEMCDYDALKYANIYMVEE